MAHEAPELDRAGIGMRVEVDDRDAAPALDACHTRNVGPGDRVIAAQHDRDGAGSGRDADRVLERVERHALLHARHLDVARVHNAHLL